MANLLPLPEMSRRRFLQIGAGLGVAAALPTLWRPGHAWAATPVTTGTGTTPEQVHLLWAFDSTNNPTNSVIVSWVQPQPTLAPQVTYASATVGLTGPGATTVSGTVNTQAGGNVNNAIPPAGSPSGTQGGFGFSYQDLLDGEFIYVYSALLTGLTPGSAYVYSVTDGAGHSFPTAAAPGAFSTAPSSPDGRIAYTFTSYGDLATPTALTGDTFGDLYTYSTWGESSPNAYAAVNAVEYFAPLFHMLNGDLCYADKNPANQPEVWRDFGMSVQRSAMNRPWMPCLGNHEAELSNGYSSYLSRYRLPDNGVGYPGNFYHYQVGSVLFIALDGNDVVYQDSAPYAAAAVTYANESLAVGASGFNRYYTGTPTATYPDDPNLKAPAGNVQATWLQNILASARPSLQPTNPPSPITIDPSIVPSSIDWIIVQMHQCVMSSTFDNGSDRGLRELWKPLFDQYQVDVVVNGHDHDYERTHPVRGYTPGQGTLVAGGAVEVLQPTPVATTWPTTTTASGTAPLIDATQGTSYFVLGGGGTNAQDNVYEPTDGAPAGTAGVHTQTIRKTPAQTKPPADAYELPVWSAVTDPAVDGVNSPYGIAVFNVDPGSGPGADSTLTVTYYHAQAFATGALTVAPVPGTNPGYTQFDQVVLTRPRSDGSAPGADLPEFATPALAVGAAAAIAGTVYLTQRGRVEEGRVEESV